MLQACIVEEAIGAEPSVPMSCMTLAVAPRAAVTKQGLLQGSWTWSEDEPSCATLWGRAASEARRGLARATAGPRCLRLAHPPHHHSQSPSPPAAPATGRCPVSCIPGPLVAGGSVIVVTDTVDEGGCS